MSKLIPAETRIQQINARPNISFVRWAGEYKNVRSKAVCCCAVDGYEWAASIDGLVNGRSGCPRCAGNEPLTAAECVRRVNELPNISFVRWYDEYHNVKSKAVVHCAIDNFEWPATVGSLVNQGCGCPQCSGRRQWTAEERIAQINAKPNVTFLRWERGYYGSKSKAVCRCSVDGYEWGVSVVNLLNNGRGCPQCAGKRRWTAEERIARINDKPNISFVRWVGSYKNARSKAVCRCSAGHEWSTSVNNLLNSGTGCPQCAPFGYNPAAPGTLYILRSDCGSMVKIGISNDHEQRHSQLKRATPFDWHCIELLHSDDGSLIAELEKELHSWTKQAIFGQSFSGSTEWRKWDDRLPRWLKRYRARLERYNKAP